MNESLNQSSTPGSRAPQLIIEEPLCLSCGRCVDACPTDVIRLNEAGIAQAVYEIDCCSCSLCVQACPTQAITLTPLRSHRGFESVYDQLGL